MGTYSRRQFFMIGTAATFAAMGLAGCAGGGFYHAENGNGGFLLECVQRRGGHGAAGDDDGLWIKGV